MNMRVAAAISLQILSACAAVHDRVPLDPVTESTALDGDATGIVEGCGHQPQVGFTYCRVKEGDATDGQIYFLGPPSECDQKDSCSYIKVWDNTGVLIWGGSIPKGRTRIGVSWMKLLSSPIFQLSHRGFFTWNTEVYWKDPDGRERVSKAQGDIVVRVFKSSYLPLDQVGADPSFVWSWSEGHCTYKMTAGLRAYLKCSN